MPAPARVDAVTPRKQNAWLVEIAPHKGAYTPHTITNRAADAIRSYDELEVTHGMRKRLIRNGVVLDRTVSQRTREQITAELFPLGDLAVVS